MNKNDINTEMLHQPFERPDAYRALSMPVYQNVAFEFESAEEMEATFCGHISGHAYSRITNPTVQYLERRIQNMQGALSVTALNSGMAAISCTFMTIARAGANIVTSPHLFGNTFSLFKNTLEPFGVEIRMCDLTQPEEVRKRIDPNTCAIFMEIITNPQLEVADISMLSMIAKEYEVPLIADTTIVPFSIFRAKDLGVDIEVLSSTKYLSGSGTGLGGLIIDYGTSNWMHSPKLAAAAKQHGASAFTNRLRTEIHRNLGCYMTPQVAFMQNLGLETVGIRFERQATTCMQLAKKLKQTSGILSVNYTGLEDHPFYELSLRQFGKHPGAMLTFDLPSREHCYFFLNHLKLIRRATNLFENKTFAIHPASTIFGTFTKEQQEKMNIKDNTIRLSVGLENIDDLYQDILQALPRIEVYP